MQGAGMRMERGTQACRERAHENSRESEESKHGAVPRPFDAVPTRERMDGPPLELTHLVSRGEPGEEP